VFNAYVSSQLLKN